MATPVKWNGEFRVNGFTTGHQHQSSVVGLADGRFVVVWTDLSGSLGDVNSAVHGQVFNADGTPRDAEFRVNDFPMGIQNLPDVTALPDGRFVAVWDNDDAIKAQVFNPDGTKFGNHITMDITDTDRPAIATLDDGRIVATWQAGGDVFTKIYTESGVSKGVFTQMNGITADEQSDTSVAGLPGGGFVAVWTCIESGVARTHGQIFDKDESGINGEFSVSSHTGHMFRPTVTRLHDDRFIVCWEDLGPNSTNIHGQIFNADGSRVGDELVIGTSPGQSAPDITVLNDGRFVVVWNDTDIHAQVFNSDGTKSGAEFVVNPDTDGYFQHDASVAALADGRFVVTWTNEDVTSDGSGAAVRAQIFDPRESGVRVTSAGLNDDLIGTDFSDVLKGGGGADHLSGMGGDDVLAGGAGLDRLFGGDGSDTARYDESSDGVIVNLQTGINSGGDAAGDIFDSIENVAGSSHHDVIFGNGADNVLDGGADGDSMVGGGGIDTVTYRSSKAGVNASLWSGLGSGGDAQGDNLDGTIENLVGSKYNDVLTGHSGANVIEGWLGHDAIDGKGGDDTAVFSHNFNEYTVTDFSSFIFVDGPDGRDRLTSIEHLRFADATVDVFDDGNPLFDTLYYLSRNPDVFHAGANALDHFNTFGWHEGRNPNALFDTSEYLSVYKDAAAIGMNPLEHYHQIGWQLGHDPAANFDTRRYLAHNPDVAAAGVDPLQHYLQFGEAEGRDSYAAIGDTIVGGFDAEFYLRRNPDVAAAGVDPLAHYNMFGWHEGRNPNARFDSAGYLAHYSDVAAAGANPLDHYEQFGWKEGRDPSASFDTLGYLAANPDVAAAGVNPLDHYLTFGIYEGRHAVNDGVWH